MSRFELTVFNDAAEVARAGAAAWLDAIQAGNKTGQPHHAALSGGRVAKALFSRVAELATESGISFQSVHFFWADERCVPPDDAESNYRTARETLFDPLKVPSANIHRIPGEQGPEAAARGAEAEIQSVVRTRSGDQPVLDWIFLGLGEDGHVASLFPGHAAETSTGPGIYRAIRNSPKPPPERVTLGYPAIAAAREVWMLATGKDKQPALRDSLSPAGKTPFARVLQARSFTRILTDIPLD